MGVLERVNGQFALRATRSRSGTDPLLWDLYQQYFSFNGVDYPLIQTTMGGLNREKVPASAIAAYKGHGPVFSLVLARMQAFSQIRFQWTRMQGSQPGDLFGTPELSVLEKPWPNGTTSDLLARMEMHNSLAGNAYVRRTAPDRLNVLRPDFVTIILGSQESADHPADAADVTVAGYLYTPAGGRPQIFLPSEIAHFAPIPDPWFHFLGQSWITPVLRELQGDQAAVEHKVRFFENAGPQPYTARVLTPDGWIRMGDVAVGDQVTGPDGKPRTVLGVYPQGEKDIYRLTFAGGATTECCRDHLWTVSNAYDRKRGTCRTMKLRELLDSGITYPSGAAKWAIQLPDPVEYNDPGPLPLDPYLLGMLLGDGGFRSNGKGSGGITLAASVEDADETEDLLRPLLPANVTITRRDETRKTARWASLYFKGPGGPKENPLTRIIRDLGLFDVHGRDKAVPGIYMRASVTSRIALLQGLIDSDGHINNSKSSSTGARFTSTSEVLARQVQELVRSLGGVAVLEPEARNGQPGRQPSWVVRFNQLPEWIIPARLARKRSVYRPYNRRDGFRGQTLRSVELVGREPAQCIKVDAEDGLYVTDDFIVTHNTLNLAIKFDPAVGIDAVKAFKELLEDEHQGIRNAWKNLYLGGGADVTPVGSTFKDMDYAVIQGRAESRLASAAGVAPSWVGFSEGLQGSALNAGNFDSARRRFTDGTLDSLWRNGASSLQAIVRAPDAGASLWYDSRVPIMRQDEGDRASVQQQEATTITALIRDGFTPDSAVAAVKNNDWSLLVHSGMVSVQLWEPGTESPAHPEPGADSPAVPAGVPAPALPPGGQPAANGNASSNGKAKVPAARALGGYPANSAPGAGSGMISLDLPEGSIQPVPGGLTDHHITVVYLGPDVDDEAFAQACARAQDAASSADGPLAGSAGGLAAFAPSDSSAGKMPVFAPVDLPGGDDLRSGLEDLSASDHQQWVPHVTLCYAEPGDPLPAPVPQTPVTFTHLSVHRGADVRRFPLGAAVPATTAP